MEISKEKFIQLFQDECSRAVDEKKYGINTRKFVQIQTLALI
jgi:non-homologous end joining protein Ku